MSNSLQVFQFHTFTLEIIERDGEPWFIARPLAEYLGYQNPAEAVRDNVDDEDIATSYIPTKSANYILVNESGLYTLILRSNKPEAKAFKRWVTREVLPSIRKYGRYINPNIQPELDEVTGNLPFQRLNTAKYDSLRKTSRILAQAYLMECGVTPDYVQQQVGTLGSHTEVYGEKSRGDIVLLVDQFIDDWKNSITLTVPFMPCLGTQVLRLFRIWSKNQSIAIYAGDNHSMAAIYQHPGLYNKRMHVSRASKASPRSVLMIEGVNVPEGMLSVDWIAGCINQVEAALKKMEKS